MPSTTSRSPERRLILPKLKITLDIELLSLLDSRVLIINNLPRKKKKRLKKELVNLLIRLLHKESYKDL